jgi:hypothetical protein
MNSYKFHLLAHSYKSNLVAFHFLERFISGIYLNSLVII